MDKLPSPFATHALYPGSFDPPTNGHLDVITRAAAIFPVLTVAVVVNPQKRDPLFTLPEREEMIRECVRHLPQVRVEHFQGLLADYVRARKADIIIKGLRVLSDFENEMATAHMNRALSGVDTMFLMASPEFSFISSSMVKEAHLLGGDVSEFVPSVVMRVLEARRAASR